MGDEQSDDEQPPGSPRRKRVKDELGAWGIALVLLPIGIGRAAKDPTTRREEPPSTDDERIDSSAMTNLKGNLIGIGICLALLPIALLLVALF